MTPAPVQDVVAMLEALPFNEGEQDASDQEVSRSDTVDLLETVQTSKPAPTQELQEETASELAEITASATFFNTASVIVSQQGACGEDLRALASGTAVYFPDGGLTPAAEGLAAARLIAQVARDCPGFTVQVEGHSDKDGTAQAKKTLSHQRADVVIARLAAEGIDTARFVPMGYGDARPSGTVGPQAKAYYDRRVEFTILEDVQQASLVDASADWQPAVREDCVQALKVRAEDMRIIYAPRAITVTLDALETVKGLATQTARCEGAQLRLVGYHSDAAEDGENASIGRLRVLTMRSSLISSGFGAEMIVLADPVASDGKPGTPRSRLDFEIIQN